MILYGPNAKDEAENLLDWGYESDFVAVYEGGCDDWEANGGRCLKEVGVPVIDFDEIRRKIADEKTTWRLIDVRTPEERIRDGHIPGDVNVPRE